MKRERDLVECSGLSSWSPASMSWQGGLSANQVSSCIFFRSGGDFVTNVPFDQRFKRVFEREAMKLLFSRIFEERKCSISLYLVEVIQLVPK